MKATELNFFTDVNKSGQKEVYSITMSVREGWSLQGGIPQETTSYELVPT
jgi:hypothetical protein